MNPLTSCGRCGRSWSALAEADCTGCCHHFGSVSAFDRHLAADGSCRPPGELLPSGRRRCVWHRGRGLWVRALRSPSAQHVGAQTADPGARVGRDTPTSDRAATARRRVRAVAP